MAKRIYVGGLPSNAEEDQLKTMFEAHGTVASVSMITDRQTGQPKGFAFVEMSDNGEADKAIAQLNGTEMSGRSLIVNEARARETTGARAGGGSRY